MLTVLNRNTVAILFLLIHRSFSSMVLPRPPSSPNHLHRFDEMVNDRKFDEGKSLQSFLRNSRMDRDNINDYSLVEIDLQSPDEVDAHNLGNIVHAMMKHPEQIRNESYPNPDVIPHSIFGVRDVGLTDSLKSNEAIETRRVLVSPPKYESFDEKLYYIKSDKPKVYVNVRGRSGSYRNDARTTVTSGSSPAGYLRVTPSFQRQTDWKSQHGRKTGPPKKFDRRADSSREYQKRYAKNETGKLNRLAVAYGLDDLSTTENSMVTSSELPKQIPAPPSKYPSRILLAQTTPVQRYALRRTDILPGYSFTDV